MEEDMASQKAHTVPSGSKDIPKDAESAEQTDNRIAPWFIKWPPKKQLFYGWVVVIVLVTGGIFLYLATRALTSESTTVVPEEVKLQLVVILISGMRPDALDKLPVSKRLGFRFFETEGVRVQFVRTVFPSEQLPSWTTLQTGLYPEAHGILGNVMYDRESERKFNAKRPSAKDWHWWQGGEPIWVTATNQGRRVAVFGWSSADVPFRNTLPEDVTWFNASTENFSKRVQVAVERLKLNFDLVMMTYDGVEEASLRYGPFSEQTRKEVESVGLGLQYLFGYLHRAELTRRVSVLVVSDRGWASGSGCAAPRVDLLPLGRRDVKRALSDARSRLLLVYARPGRAPRLLLRLTAALAHMPGSGYQARLRTDIPSEFHYKGGKWAPDILLYPKGGNSSKCGETKNLQNRKPQKVQEMGATFEPSAPAMLLGWGKGIQRSSLVHPPIHLVDVYQVMAHLLGVLPRPHNGSWKAVSSFLGKQHHTK